MVISWLLLFSFGNRISIYCSDVSGAFDNVCSRLLLRKINNYFSANILRTLASWLDGRKANVCINGTESTTFSMDNMVYQGTVLGPLLWNLFFADTQYLVSSRHFDSIVYAADLNVYKSFANDTSNESIFTELNNMQSHLHSWDSANFISIDGIKESKHITSRRSSSGSDFRILGYLFDCKLSMSGCIHETVLSANWQMNLLC